MRTFSALSLVAASLALTACTATGPRTPYGRFMEARANPGKVVATELAFARAAISASFFSP